MPRKCSVCEHNEVKEINRMLIAGRAVTEVARHFDMPYDAVWNHKRKHISENERLKIRKEQEINLVDYLQELRENLKQSKSIFEDAKRKKHYSTALKALSEIRRALELIADIQENDLSQEQPEGSGISEEQRQTYYSRLNEVETKLLDKITDSMLNEKNEPAIPNNPELSLSKIIDFKQVKNTPRKRQKF